MAATNYSLLIPRVRLLADDPEAGTAKFGETPTGLRDGTNGIFRLSQRNIVSGSIFMTYGDSSRSQSGFSVLDYPSGYLSVSPVPDAGLTNPWFFDYLFQLYTDADYQSFIDEGTNFLGGTIGTDVDPGLYPAQVRYALSCFYNRRASDKAKEYASSGGGIGAQPQTPAQAFTKLAQEAAKIAVQLRDDFYKRQGQREAPASGTVSYQISPQQTPY